MQPWENEYEEPRKQLRLGEFVEHVGFIIVVCTCIYGNLLYSCVRQRQRQRQRLKRSKNRK